MKTKAQYPTGGIPPARQITYQAQKVKPTAKPPTYTGSRSEAAGRMLKGSK